MKFITLTIVKRDFPKSLDAVREWTELRLVNPDHIEAVYQCAWPDDEDSPVLERNSTIQFTSGCTVECVERVSDIIRLLNSKIDDPKDSADDLLTTKPKGKP